MKPVVAMCSGFIAFGYWKQPPIVVASDIMLATSQ
jgi:hypothetical protein